MARQGEYTLLARGGPQNRNMEELRRLQDLLNTPDVLHIY
jgi:hypothetical protein